MIYTLTLNPAIDCELRVAGLEFNQVLRAAEKREDPGGKGFNVARMVEHLGGPVTALGLSAGMAGQRLQHLLAQQGLKTLWLPVAGETRTNFSLVEAQQARYLKVNEPGPALDAAARRQVLAWVGSLVRPGDAWVLAGSLPPGLEPGFYAELVRLLQSAGAWVALDCSGPALHAGCEAGPEWVKPNLEEAASALGRPVSSFERGLETALALHTLGAKNVLLSAGSAGALLLAATPAGPRAWQARPPLIREANPIGAGDAALGGLVWALVQGLPLPDVLRWSVACGAAAASLAGTAFGTRAQVAPLLEQVTLVAL